MSDQLGELLRELADDAPAIDSSPAVASAVWRRARRSKRRDMIAAVSLSVVLLLVGGLVIGLIGPGLQSTPPTAPAYGDGRLAIPNQIWTPSPWTPGTADAGPIGPLALIATAPRRTSWWHTDQFAFFGVSAKTGQYRFLDLPRLASDSGVDPVLSPDGRYIAYFMTGPPSGAYVQSDVTGLAIYNTESGAATFHAVPTIHGLGADSVTWNGNSTRVVTVFGQYTTQPGTYYIKPPLVANAMTGMTSRLPLTVGNVLDGGTAGPVPGGVGAVSPDAAGLVTVNLRTGAVVRYRFELSRKPNVGPTGRPIVTPLGVQLVFMGQSNSSRVGPKVYLASLPSDAGPRRHRSLIAVQTGQPFVVSIDGWDANDRLLIEQSPPGRHRFSAVPQIYSVGLTGGAPRLAIKLHGRSPAWMTPSLASDLVARPLIGGRHPDSPNDPRLIPGIVFGVLVALGLVWYVIAGFRRLGRVPPQVASSSGPST